jgi:membrane protease YdiL (CAAX protease family)
MKVAPFSFSKYRGQFPDWPSAVIVFGFSGLTTLLYLMIRPIVLAAVDDPARGMAVTQIVTTVIAFAAVLVPPFSVRSVGATLASGDRLTWSGALVAIFGGIACVVLSIGIFAAVRYAFGPSAATVKMMMPAGWQIDPWILLMTMANFVILGPFIEEYIFRSWLFHRLKERGKLRLFLTVSPGAFSVAHMNQSLLKVVTIMMLGMLCTWLYVKTRGLLAPFLAHATNNGFAMALALSGY